jgi:hypothetical protein
MPPPSLAADRVPMWNDDLYVVLLDSLLHARGRRVQILFFYARFF